MEANAAGVGAIGTLPANPGMDACIRWSGGQGISAARRCRSSSGDITTRYRLGRAVELRHDLTGAIAIEPFVGDSRRLMYRHASGRG